MEQIHTNSKIRVITSGGVPNSAKLPHGDLAFGVVNGESTLYGNRNNTILELTGLEKGPKDDFARVAMNKRLQDPSNIVFENIEYLNGYVQNGGSITDFWNGQEILQVNGQVMAEVNIMDQSDWSHVESFGAAIPAGGFGGGSFPIQMHGMFPGWPSSVGSVDIHVDVQIEQDGSVQMNAFAMISDPNYVADAYASNANLNIQIQTFDKSQTFVQKKSWNAPAPTKDMLVLGLEDGDFKTKSLSSFDDRYIRIEKNLTWYVNQYGGDDTNDGKTAGTAFRTINAVQNALTLTKSDIVTGGGNNSTPVTIYLAPGEYVASIPAPWAWGTEVLQFVGTGSTPQQVILKTNQISRFEWIGLTNLCLTMQSTTLNNVEFTHNRNVRLTNCAIDTPISNAFGNLFIVGDTKIYPKGCFTSYVGSYISFNPTTMVWINPSMNTRFLICYGGWVDCYALTNSKISATIGTMANFTDYAAILYAGQIEMGGSSLKTIFPNGLFWQPAHSIDLANATNSHITNPVAHGHITTDTTNLEQRLAALEARIDILVAEGKTPQELAQMGIDFPNSLIVAVD